MDENIQNAVENAFGDNVADMQSDIESALQYKIINALEQKRIQIAQSLINNENIDPDEDEEELEDIQELSKGTLQSYVNKRQWDMGANEKMQKKMDTGLARAETKLKGDQHKLDKNKNGKIDAHDFKLLRKENEVSFGEGWDDDEDDDVARADRELKRMKAKPIAAAKIDPDKDKIKRTKKDREEEMDESEESRSYRVEFDHGPMTSYGMNRKEGVQKHITIPGDHLHSKKDAAKHLSKKFENPKVIRMMEVDPKSITNESIEDLEEIAKWRKGEPQVAFGGYDQEISGTKPKVNKKATYALDKWSGQKIPLQSAGKDKEDELEGRKGIADKGYKTKKTLKTTIKQSLGKHGKSDLPESYIEEKLDASMGVKKYIDDFIKSDNPKFEGKSKKERIEMALGAFYSAKKGKTRNEEYVSEDSLDRGDKYLAKHNIKDSNDLLDHFTKKLGTGFRSQKTSAQNQYSKIGTAHDYASAVDDSLRLNRANLQKATGITRRHLTKLHKATDHSETPIQTLHGKTHTEIRAVDFGDEN